MQIQTLEELLNTELRKLCSVEEQLIAAIPEMEKAAEDENLKDSLSEHLETTKQQLERLQRIEEDNNLDLSGETDKGMESLTKEGKELVEKISDKQIKDIAIICATNKVEHYEIAAYQGAIAIADKLEKDDIASVLKETLNEEKNAASLMESMAGNGLMAKMKQALS